MRWISINSSELKSLRVGRLINIVLAVVILSITFIGCSSDKQAKVEEQKQNSMKIKIGFSMDTLVQERWLRDRDVFVARANELGAEVIVQSANSDAYEQEKQVQYLIDQGIDVLVIIPHDAEKAAAIAKSAKEKGIKVICYDRLIKNAQCDLYVSFDNNKVGELMAQTLVNTVPTGNYLIINGSPLDNNSFMFNEGYMKVLSPYISNKKITIVGEEWAMDWRYEVSFNFVEKELKANTKIDAIIAGNDTLAGAAIDALAEIRAAGKIPVVGHDADLDGCQRIVEGTQLATVYKPINKIARAAANFAVKLAKNEKLEISDEINDGKGLIPYYKIPPILVTKDNMYEVIIGDSFHKIEDVYMNVPKTKWPKTN